MLTTFPETRLTFAVGKVEVARGTLVTEGSPELSLAGALQRPLAHAEGQPPLIKSRIVGEIVQTLCELSTQVLFQGKIGLRPPHSPGRGHFG
jgi:hypothetical protein